MSDVVSPAQIAASLNEHWFPRVVGEVDDSYVKVARVKGTLAWHSHEDEDEMFFVLKGSLKIEMRDRTVDLSQGDMFIVPRGVEHNPIADEECLLLLFERKSTQHTGTVVTEKTRSVSEQQAD